MLNKLLLAGVVSNLYISVLCHKEGRTIDAAFIHFYCSILLYIVRILL